MNNENSVRSFKGELNILNKNDGSGLFSQGNTVMLAAIYGPTEPKYHKLQLDKTNFEVVCRNRGQTNDEKTNTSVIKSACGSALFPKVYDRNEIILTIQEMQDCGSSLSCSINAGCLALINSGLEMQCLVASCTSILNEKNEIILDPDSAQIEKSKCRLVVAFTNVTYDIVGLTMKGICPLDKYQEMLQLCKEGAKIIFNYYRTIVEKYCNKIYYD